MADSTPGPYLHGFSQREQERLRQQARFLEFAVYQDVDFFRQKDILEVGCGVGAQSEILLRRFPELQLTGVDMSQAQVDAATAHLSTAAHLKGRYRLQQMDASDLKFPSASFDGAFLCWILEHVPSPARILSEVRRVLRPGARIYVTEVMNHSFFLDPYSPNVWKYWMAFNDYQYEQAGDPFVGAKLGNLMAVAGFHSIQTHVKTLHFDNRAPAFRREVIEYWTDLLLSAADQLIQAGATTQETVDAVVAELSDVKKDPNAVFFYSFMQACARV